MTQYLVIVSSVMEHYRGSMRILAIETSCDETAAAVVEDGTRVRANAIATSRQSFERLAGVIPEQAARAQTECMIPVLKECLMGAGLTMHDIDAIAVTRGPGLLGSLLVGTTTARVLASVLRKPLIGVHHTLGHLSSTWLETTEEPRFPVLTLSASGGHTDVWYRESHVRGALLGRTRDDAAGEAFDKGASLLGLPYPGGPAIARAAERGNDAAFAFPLPLRDDSSLAFSFSGLKTALKYALRDLGYEDPSLIPKDVLPHLAASYQRAICDHLSDRMAKALASHPDARELHVVGGVSANTVLRARLRELCTEHRITFRAPLSMAYCTDNAAMIAAAAYFFAAEKGEDATAPFTTHASLPLEQTVA